MKKILLLMMVGLLVMNIIPLSSAFSYSECVAGYGIGAKGDYVQKAKIRQDAQIYCKEKLDKAIAKNGNENWAFTIIFGGGMLLLTFAGVAWLIWGFNTGAIQHKEKPRTELIEKSNHIRDKEDRLRLEIKRELIKAIKDIQNTEGKKDE